MSDLQATIAFPGIPLAAIRSGSFTLGHGVTPSSCTIRVVPNQSIAADVGDLEIHFGRTTLKFADCKLDRGRAEVTSRGTTLSIRILDRRWKWETGTISGRYNLRGEDGELDEKRPRKSPQQLAKLLLEEMGESRADVSALPDGPRPEINWDLANPARELAELCESLGCRVVLGSDDKVSIRKLGEGRRLPAGGTVMNVATGIENTVLPDELKLLGGALLFQSRFLLEPVGEDKDGEIKPIDKLSYRPDGGWTGSAIEAKDVDFERDGVTMSTRQLAGATVWRMYRVKEQATGGLNLPGFKTKVKSLDQYELNDHLAETSKDPDGIKRYKPAQVDGVYFADTARAGGNTAPGTRLP